MEIYVDGSYSPSSDIAGVGIYANDCTYKGIFGEDECRITLSNISIPIVRSNLNNSDIEVIAVCIALVITQGVGDIIIYSDSQHAVDPLTIYYERYKNNNWLTFQDKKLSGYEIFSECSKLMDKRNANGQSTKIVKVAGHSEIYGNDVANELAHMAILSGSKDNIRLLKPITIVTTIENAVKEAKIPMPVHIIPSNFSDTSRNSELQDVHKDLTIAVRTKTNEVHGNFFKYYCFVLCISCTEMMCIRTSENNSASTVVMTSDYPLSMFVTTCMVCSNINKPILRDNTPISLRISLPIIATSKYGSCVSAISNMPMDQDDTRKFCSYMHVQDVLNMCDSKCTIVSVDVANSSLLTYLRVGFVC